MRSLLEYNHLMRNREGYAASISTALLEESNPSPSLLKPSFSAAGD